MRLITWNCNRCFEKKLAPLLALSPDIALVQECSEASLSKLPDSYGSLFVPSHTSLGIGIVYRKEVLQVSLLEKLANLVVAFEVRGLCSFRLLAVWTCPPQKTGYIEEIHRVLDTRQSSFKDEPCIIAGDWNSHPRWDRLRKRGHITAVQRLGELGIQSAYHKLTGETAGSEESSTFYQYRHTDKPYHIDYVFASDSLLSSSSLHIEPFSRWGTLSDHVPVVFDFFPEFERSVKDSEA